MAKEDSLFGWKSVLYNYGWRGILLDSILPFSISLLLCVIMYWGSVDVFEQLKHLLEVGVSIVPAMVALILTAYTIMLTFIISDTKFLLVKKTEEGRSLIKSINASFAACLFVSITTIISMIVISNIANMEIAIKNAELVNYIVFFIICYLLVYSVSILIGIVIDIFNSGQTALLEE